MGIYRNRGGGSMKIAIKKKFTEQELLKEAVKELQQELKKQGKKLDFDIIEREQKLKGIK